MEELLEPSLEEELLGAAPPPLPPLDLGVPPPPPGLEELLRGVGALLGGRGVTGDTLRGLRQAGEGLRVGREAWLRWEGLERGLRDLLSDPHILPHGVQQELEGALALAELRLGGLPHGAPRPRPPSPPPPLLSLVLPSLERVLGQKALSLGNYYFGETPPHPGGGTGPPPNPAPRLEEMGQRLNRAQVWGRSLGGQLRRIRGVYPETASRCGAGLREALSALIGGPGPEGAGPAERRGLYLEGKGAALLLKARLEEVTLLLETYPPPTLRAHARIRLGLEEARQRAEREAGLLREEEKAAIALGPAYLAVAREYGRLRELIGQRQWALKELRLHRR